MKIFRNLRDDIFPIIRYQRDQIAQLRKSLESTMQQLKEEAASVKEANGKLQYFSTLLVARDGCKYHLLIFPLAGPQLLTTRNDGKRMNFILHDFATETESLIVYANPIGDEFLITEVTMEEAFNNNHLINRLAQEIIVVAKEAGTKCIKGVIDTEKFEKYDWIINFYKAGGFKMTTREDQLTVDAIMILDE